MTEESCPKPSEESMAAVNASRQRKKRKWDQPAESLLSAVLAVPGALPMGMGGLVGITLPGANPLSGALLKNQAPATCATASQLIQAHAISQNAAAIVQKLNQPKVQDEQIAREIVINDAEPTVRYKLTKRQTQEEIQKCTGAVVITRGKYRPPNGLPDNEKPLYLHISAGAHLKDMAERIKAVDRAASMVEEILKHSQNSMPASTPFHSVLSNGQVTQPLSTCLFLGFDTDPSLNIAARIRGPNDQYINHIMNETGATVVLRGRGSGNIESFLTEEVQQPLHLYLSSTNAKSLEDAKILAENLLDTICVECGASRISSCKVYSAVPPPQQLLVGVQSYAKELAGSACTTIGSMPATPTFAPSGVPVSSGSNICPPGAGVQTAALFNYENSASNISFPSRSSTGGTSYNGYGGIYPQATPLQQVALALRQAPTSTSSILASTTSSTSTLPNAASSSSVEREKRKRKFQELPVVSKGPTTFQNLRQGSEFLKPGSEDSSVKNVSCMPPPKKLVQPGSDGMPPPPPRNVPLPLHSRIIPPPPPKFSSPKSPPKAENGKSDQKKSRTEPVSGTDMENKSVLEKRSANPVSETLLKLVEYGEEDEEDIDGTGEESSTSNPMRSMTVKPFWAL